MKRTLALASLLASSLLAADNGANVINPDALLLPGIWASCESLEPPPIICQMFKPGGETYSIYLKQSLVGAIGWHYKVSGTRADGVLLTIEGVALNTNPSGTTIAIVAFGAPVSNTTVLVAEIFQSGDLK